MNYYNLILIFIFVIFLVMCNFLFLVFLKLDRNFLRIRKSTYLLLLMIFVLGFVLRMFIVPHMHNLYYDEVAYLDIAKNIAEDSNNCLCLLNKNSVCEFCGFSLKSIGFTFLIALFFKLLGVSSSLAFNLVAIIGSLTVILMFFFSYFLFKKEALALLASSVIAFYPLHMRWSGSVSAEIVSLFFILLSFCLLFIYLKKKDTTCFLALILVTIFTITIKEENLIILPFILIPFIYKKFLRKKFLLTTLFFFLLFLPYFFGIFFFHASPDMLEEGSRYTFWKGGQFFSWKFFKSDFLSNLYFFINQDYTSFLLLLFLPISLFFLFKDNKKLLFLLLVATLILPAIFSAYIGEHLSFSEVRHYIFSIFPFSLILCYGMYKIILVLKRKKLVYLFVLFIITSTAFYFPYLTSDKAPVEQAQQDYETLLDSLELVPEDCIVLTQESYLFDYHNRNAASIFIPNLELRGCILFYEGELCYRREAFDECARIKDSVSMKQIYSDGRHSLYKLNQESLALDEVFTL